MEVWECTECHAHQGDRSEQVKCVVCDNTSFYIYQIEARSESYASKRGENLHRITMREANGY